MKLVSWNVNSVRARQDRLLAFLERHDPDVVCLQETKVVDGSFPTEEIRRAGYESTLLGQKTYNGVAILSRQPPDRVKRGFEDGGDDSQARMIAASIEGVRCVCVYVPNGRSVGSESYEYKLDWLARLRRFLEQDSSSERPLALLGDFNVAPTDIDVHDPAVWRGEIMCSDAEREAFAELGTWGLTDSFRALYPNEQKFTWWGLPPARVSEGPWPADRPHPCDGAASGPAAGGRGGPGGTERQGSVRPRPRACDPGLAAIRATVRAPGPARLTRARVARACRTASPARTRSRAHRACAAPRAWRAPRR